MSVLQQWPAAVLVPCKALYAQRYADTSCTMGDAQARGKCDCANTAAKLVLQREPTNGLAASQVALYGPADGPVTLFAAHPILPPYRDLVVLVALARFTDISVSSPGARHSQRTFSRSSELSESSPFGARMRPPG